MPKQNVVSYKPSAFVPNTSYTGDEPPLVVAGENMWLRYSRAGNMYAEGYSGNKALSAPQDDIPTKQLTGTITWDSDTRVLTGVGSAFRTELNLGSFVLANVGANQSELLVIEEIIDDTTATICEGTTVTNSDPGILGYVLPICFPVNTKLGTAIRGNVLSFFKGHYLGVGDGEFRIDGNPLNSSLNLTKYPQFALYDPILDTYTINDFGINPPSAKISLTAVTIDPTITGATNANPCVITVAGLHCLHTGQVITISGVAAPYDTLLTGQFEVTRLTNSTFSVNVDASGQGAPYVGAGTITGTTAQMRAGDYNIRVCAKNTGTKGFSQPSPVIAPITLAAGQAIKVTFNSAMWDDQNAYDIYGTQFLDNSTATVEARYMGPWYRILEDVTADMLVDNSHATGRESGTNIPLSYSDAEISAANQILTFDNFPAVDAEFLDFINGIPILFSCLGKGDPNNPSGKSPGPAAIPSKPTNPEAIILNKTITTAGGDIILGEFNLKSRIFVLCQNSLQSLVLTTLDEEPIAFRSLWNSGFRNPYNVDFIKEYLYGFSTHQIIRSVAGGDDTSEEFDFASDIANLTKEIPCAKVLVKYDPKNRAMCFFHSGAERRNGYLVTKVYPWLIDKNIWNPPIILSKEDTDFVVSGVSIVGENLVFLAGGRNSVGNVVVGTYIFDGGDSETKDWSMAWNYSDIGLDINAKTIKGASITGRFSSDVKVDTFGAFEEDAIDTDFSNGYEHRLIFENPGSTSLKRRRFRTIDDGPYCLHAVKISGSYTDNIDRFDELSIKIEVNSSEG